MEAGVEEDGGEGFVDDGDAGTTWQMKKLVLQLGPLRWTDKEK